MSDTFTWSMTAFPHAGSVRALRMEIAVAHATEDKLPVGLILDLLPLSTPNIQEGNERGSFSFKANKFENNGEPIHMEFFDPVLDTYYLDIPASWTGEIVVAADSSSIEITFIPALEMELPKLAELGVGRSKFQLVEKLTADDFRTVTHLKDTVNGNMSVLDVQLKESAVPLELGITGRIVGLSTSGCPGEDPDDPNWYVYEKNGLCFVHKGSIIYGANGYSYRYGPARLGDCNAYADRNCNL